MDLLKAVKRRSAISDLIYNILNIGLAIALLVVIQTAGILWPALLLVLLSKWRVLAVRPRYWLANIQANLVDFIVSFSTVVFLFGAQESGALQIIITLLYIAWLLALKPRSKRHLVVVQAGVAAFVGMAALSMISFAWPVSIVVAGAWLIGYASARHALSAYDESHILVLSLIWGFVVAEISWIAYHWTVAYDIPGLAGIEIPQIALLVLAISFVAERVYSSYAKHDEFRMADVVLPLLLAGSIGAVLLLFFNSVGFGQN